ncbi:hypothetical protein [Brevundimonas sp.]|uniref:hypothetical protein n=1 Tax=Brevundimonas sp. TaxID=1871086 RepID=UPI003D109165
MSPFEFFFSFYGLLLGLSVAVLLTGFTNVLKQRKRVRVGWLTPLLSAFVLVDISSFWTGAWSLMQDVPIRLLVLVIGLVAAGSYYIAASLTVPDDVESWPDFDEYFDAHKHWVMGGVIVANLVAFEVMPWFTGQTVADRMEYYSDPRGLLTVAYLATCLAVAFVKSRRLNLIFLLALLVYYGVVASRVFAAG